MVRCLTPNLHSQFECAFVSILSFLRVGGCGRVDGEEGVGEGFLTGDPIRIGGGSQQDERFEGQLC